MVDCAGANIGRAIFSGECRLVCQGEGSQAILSRLGSELVDNIPSDTPATQRGLGATRWQIFLFTAVPSLFSRFLIFFFYRLETCVRDATILGMLGIPTLGYYILEARAKDHLDEMLYFVLLGSSLVFVCDLLSALVRWRLARAG